MLIQKQTPRSFMIDARKHICLHKIFFKKLNFFKVFYCQMENFNDHRRKLAKLGSIIVEKYFTCVMEHFLWLLWCFNVVMMITYHFHGSSIVNHRFIKGPYFWQQVIRRAADSGTFSAFQFRLETLKSCTSNKKCLKHLQNCSINEEASIFNFFKTNFQLLSKKLSSGKKN